MRVLTTHITGTSKEKKKEKEISLYDRSELMGGLIYIRVPTASCPWVTSKAGRAGSLQGRGAGGKLARGCGATGIDESRGTVFASGVSKGKKKWNMAVKCRAEYERRFSGVTRAKGRRDEEGEERRR